MVAGRNACLESETTSKSFWKASAACVSFRFSHTRITLCWEHKPRHREDLHASVVMASQGFSHCPAHTSPTLWGSHRALMHSHLYTVTAPLPSQRSRHMSSRPHGQSLGGAHNCGFHGVYTGPPAKAVHIVVPPYGNCNGENRQMLVTDVPYRMLYRWTG